tara:strand:- start:475 stop:672 length:198 start_codon:yes stop_codon:yes gene_type:complete
MKTNKQRIEEIIESYKPGETFFTRDFKSKAYDIMGKYTPCANSIGLRLRASPKTIRIADQTWRRV